MRLFVHIIFFIQSLTLCAQWKEIGNTSTFLTLTNTSDTVIYSSQMCVTESGKVYLAYVVKNSSNPNCLLEWDGTQWKVVPGIKGWVSTMYYSNGLLYVAGDIQVNSIHSQVAIWNGSNWIDLGIPCAIPSKTFKAVSISGSSSGLVYTSFHELASSINTYDKIYKYENNLWSLLPPIFTNSNHSGVVETFIDNKGGFYCNGYHIYNSNSLVNTPHFVKYNNNQWDIIDTSIFLRAIAEKNDQWILGGVQFNNNNYVIPGPTLFTYSSSILSPIASCADTSIYGGYLFAAGNGENIYSVTGNKFGNFNGIKKWNGSQWDDIPFVYTNNNFLMAADTLGHLYVVSVYRGSDRIYVIKYLNSKEVGFTQESLSEFDVDVFPNPFQSTIKITLHNNHNLEPSSVQLINTMGVVLLVQSLEEKNELDLSNVPRGLYTLVIHLNNQVAIRKIVKH